MRGVVQARNHVETAESASRLPPLSFAQCSASSAARISAVALVVYALDAFDHIA
jgi:hypothetical protein